MNVDIRVPIGFMFFMIGVLLTGYGAATTGDVELYAKSLGYNINLWWGMALLIFGGSFLFMGWRSSRSTKPDK